MTPAARLSAAIAVLDHVLDGSDAESALSLWGRTNRYAGSGDRHAVRDLVFDALRRKRSAAALGGAMSGRGLILGLLRQRGLDPASGFSGLGHAPAPLTPADSGSPAEGLAALDCPDWLGPALRASLGDDFVPVMEALQDRAPVYLRVNPRKGSRAQAAAQLMRDGIATIFTPDVEYCLQVTDNPRKIHLSTAYQSGLVELQDRSSQAVVQALPLFAGARVLDFCAGGGGKSLAMAALCTGQFHAFDINPARLKDLPQRAGRAGVAITLLGDPSARAPYDLVLCDAPCSGSGSWRRDPQGKWALSPPVLAKVTSVQSRILDQAEALVRPGGVLAYATCSLLRDENEDQVGAFIARHPQWSCTRSLRFSPLSGGDGFFLALLRVLNQN